MRALATSVVVLAVALGACSSGHDGPQGTTGSNVTGTPGPCDPFAPAPKPIALGRVLAAGRSAAGTIYVADDAGGYQNHVFVSSAGVLERQRIAGSGSSPDFYVFTITNHSPPFILQIDVVGGVVTAMGVLEGPPPTDSKTIDVGTQGEALTLLAASDVASMPLKNLPGTQVLEYDALTPDGREIVVVRPRDDWNGDCRVFFGQPPALAERTGVNLSRGNDTWITFDLDGAQATALFRWILTADASAPGEATLTVGGTVTDLTLTSVPHDGQPPGLTYTCLGR